MIASFQNWATPWHFPQKKLFTFIPMRARKTLFFYFTLFYLINMSINEYEMLIYELQ